MLWAAHDVRGEVLEIQFPIERTAVGAVHCARRAVAE